MLHDLLTLFTLFISLFFFLHCQRNRLNSVLRESSWEMSGQDPVLSAQQVILPTSHLAEEGGSFCLPDECPSPMAWGSWTMGRPGLLKLQHAFPSSSLTLTPSLVHSFGDKNFFVGDHTLSSLATTWLGTIRNALVWDFFPLLPPLVFFPFLSLP
jgi:hypothetical protein